MLGLRKSSHTTPLLRALNIKSIPSYLNSQSMNLLRSCLMYESKASYFYASLLSQKSNVKQAKTLVHRCSSFCNSYGYNLIGYITNDNYKNTVLKQLKCAVPTGCDGIIDSIRHLCLNYDMHARHVLQGLVSAV